jgi:hypothetical protein
VIFSDSLSTMMATSGNNYTKNPMTRNITQLMDKRKGNVILCWVPGHAGITGNEEAIPNDEKYPPEDLSGWIKTEMASSRQRRWEEGDNAIKERKKNTGWQNDTESLYSAA